MRIFQIVGRAHSPNRSGRIFLGLALPTLPLEGVPFLAECGKLPHVSALWAGRVQFNASQCSAATLDAGSSFDRNVLSLATDDVVYPLCYSS